MSEQVRKPGQATPKKVKNHELLPSVFITDPNKKMLDGSLDAMTSKGQLVPFKETFGLRSASNKQEEFFRLESDQVRRESQTNNMLVLKDSNENYLGKSSYLDIENYFRVKNFELKDGIVLDKNINILDLPINHLKLTDYHLYYWLEHDLPPCRLHFNQKIGGGNKFSISQQLIGRPFAKILDDLTGKVLDLKSGMTVFFTGYIDPEYRTIDIENPKLYLVAGVERAITLLPVPTNPDRVPKAIYKKRPWDKDDAYIDYPAIKWDSENWDGSRLTTGGPEYVIQDRYLVDGNANHWQALDHWYHISTIRSVANFLGINISQIVSIENKALRPIINFFRNVKLANWPDRIISDITSIFAGKVTDYQNRISIIDSTGYLLKDQDRVVFEETNGLYRANVDSVTGEVTFSQVVDSIEYDGCLITTANQYLHYQVIFKKGKWRFAQNKTEKNQSPKYEFFLSDSTDISNLNDTNFDGGVILGYKEGTVFDTVLEKYIEVSSIDFDLIDENNSSAVSPNQIKFSTDVDSEFYYYNSITNEQIVITGPYGYRNDDKIIPFYQPRRGIDYTRQVQDLVVDLDNDSWSADVVPTAASYYRIHVYYDTEEKIKFYVEVEEYGLLRFSSRRGINAFEQLLPLVSGNRVYIHCHDLPLTFTLYTSAIVDNISSPQAIPSTHIFNNGIKNGVIELNLNRTITIGGVEQTNYLLDPDLKLYWRYGNTFKTALIRSSSSWAFITSVYTKDYTNPLYYNYDYTVEKETIDAYYDTIINGPLLTEKVNTGDKILVSSLVAFPESRTAPLSLTVNPLNEKLGTVNYYSLYQHSSNIKANGINTREYVDPENLSNSSSFGGGTFLKHNDPLSKLAVLATNMPFDFTEIILKQGKHYDIFLNKLKLELSNTIDTTEYNKYDSWEILNIAISKIYRSTANETAFWLHSNMMGWGSIEADYREISHDVTATKDRVYLSGDLEPISYRTGKERILHVIIDGKIAMKDYDYFLNSSELEPYYQPGLVASEELADGIGLSESGLVSINEIPTIPGAYNGFFRDGRIDIIDPPSEYTIIAFAAHNYGKTVTIKQWYKEYNSQIPASLTKIGLSPLYMPEIYRDTSYNPDKWFLVRHDGTRHYMEEGVDINSYPVNLVDQYLYEYEKAVWSSIARDVEKNNIHELVQNQPSYFNRVLESWARSRSAIANEYRKWQLENNIFVTDNSDYFYGNGFTYNYQNGSADDNTTVTGSWRAIYKYIYGTDRPHTHPWEMLGYTVKPIWWDGFYSWTVPAKRAALERALRVGNIGEPPFIDIRPELARLSNLADPESFPVSLTGALIPPNELEWLTTLSSGDALVNWSPGQIGPYEFVFLNTHYGLASQVKQNYLLAPAQFVSLLWVPGQTIINEWRQKVDRTDKFWQRGNIAHDYHRKLIPAYEEDVVFIESDWIPGTVYNDPNENGLIPSWLVAQSYDNNRPLVSRRSTGWWREGIIENESNRIYVDTETVYTGGIESLMVEFAVLHNKNFETEIIEKFNNLQVHKEFLLNGFSNKDNIRIESTSINSQRQLLFVPEENYSVRAVKHYPHQEIFYSGMRIIWDGDEYSINGFTNEFGYFPYFLPKENSPTVGKEIGNAVFNEKLYYTNTIDLVSYGQTFTNRQEIYDFIIGYGKYLESLGFVYEEVEIDDLLNWQLSAKQFIFWSNDILAPGNYIDLNPSHNYIKIEGTQGQLENLEGTNDNPGQCIDRLGRPIFAKDLLVYRGDDNIVIKAKNPENSVYGIKMTFVDYESVIHLENTSVFDDIYFLPEQSTTKRSFVVGGKRSQAWNGKYHIPGYMFSGDGILPNYDSMAEVGKNLLDVENVVLDPTILEASRSQFGLTRNEELRQLFLEEDNEVLFKNAITYNKGTSQVFNSLNPLTHKDGSTTTPYEEYMVRTGELGNVKNIEYYEFELGSEQITESTQLIKFVHPDEPTEDRKTVYIKDDSKTWVHRPYNKTLSFSGYEVPYTELESSGPIIIGDVNFAVEKLEDLSDNYDKFVDLWLIEHYNPEQSYKKYDQVRYNGFLYYATTTVSPNSWANNADKFAKIDEPWLPSFHCANYSIPNPDISGTGSANCVPGVWQGTWQVLQTVDRNLAITESCPGPTDTSKARITLNKDHNCQAGDYVVIVNCASETTSANGVWRISELEPGSPTQFYIDAKVTGKITTGKVFPLKPTRFKNQSDLSLVTGANADNYGYAWRRKFVPFTNALNETAISPPETPSGYNAKLPVAIVDDGSNNGCGNFQVYTVKTFPQGSGGGGGGGGGGNDGGGGGGNDGGGGGGTQPGDTIVKNLVKEKSSAVDPSDIEHLIVYDYVANKTLAKLEVFDPRKLFIHKAFRDDIDVIDRVDPAKYNRTTDDYKSVYGSLAWYEEFVGRRWWDTSNLKFNDYESGDDYNKMTYWGTTIDNLPAEIYEWTRSPVHPSQWGKLVENRFEIDGVLVTGDAYVDRSLGSDNYHWVEEIDYNNGNTFITYYFWVKNKRNIPQESKAKRAYTVDQLARTVLNPSAAGLAWWAPISPRSIIVRGIDTYLNNSSTVVQIKKKIKGEEKHQQWTFISENNTVETIPEWVHVRFRDSISAHVFYKIIAVFDNYRKYSGYNQSDIVKYDDKFYICKMVIPSQAGEFDPTKWQLLTDVFEINGSLLGTWDGYFWDRRPWDNEDLQKLYFYVEKQVPDLINLHRYNRNGNQIRPYIQSWFSDILEARRTFVKKLNEIMLNVDVVSLPNWGETRLNNTLYTVADQTIDVTAFWYYADYSNEEFDSTKEIDFVINSIVDLNNLVLKANNYIKVFTGLENYTIYRRNSDGSFSIMFRKNGTIQFSDILYSNITGWDATIWDSNRVPYDYDFNTVFNGIVDCLRYEIFTGSYLKYYSLLICAMFRYVLSEQINVDWLAKSSTIEPVNLIGNNLENVQSLTRDEITVLTNFYSSVKSYRDKIRGGTVNKNSMEETTITVSEGLRIRDIT